VLPVALALAIVSALAALVLSGHERGGRVRSLELLQRLPLLGRLARSLEPRRPALAQMDQQITAFYHASPGRFWTALGLEYLSRSLWMVEYWLICHGVGIAATFAQAFLIGGLSSLVQNALFFVPYELGTKEGALYALFKLAGLDPRAGVYTAVVSRARDLLWIAGGLGLLAVLRHDDAATSSRVVPPAEPAL